jgi:hypothetical protein
MVELADTYHDGGIRARAYGGAELFKRFVGSAAWEVAMTKRGIAEGEDWPEPMLRMSSVKVEFSVEEAGYVLGLLKEHLEYYRALAGNHKCTEANLARHRMVEGLWVKLAR